MSKETCLSEHVGPEDQPTMPLDPAAAIDAFIDDIMKRCRQRAAEHPEEDWVTVGRRVFQAFADAQRCRTDQSQQP